MSRAVFVEVPVIISPAQALDNPLICSWNAPVLIVREMEISGLLASCRNSTFIPLLNFLHSFAGNMNIGFSADNGAIDLSIFTPLLAIYEF